MLQQICFLCVGGYADDTISVYSICISKIVGEEAEAGKTESQGILHKYYLGK